jgi:SPP1 gp7 family putative phage head morphogenesis protein
LRTIYQTNLQTSYMAGRYKQQMEVASALPYWQFIAVLDGQTTDRCRSLHLRVFRADDPIWDYLYPPNHWGCRSRVRALTANQFERSGANLDNSDGKIVTREATIGKNENAVTVSVKGFKLNDQDTYWPDPGWDYNPGKQEFKPDLKRYDKDIRNQIKDTP